jgi:hypothetical protein
MQNMFLHGLGPALLVAAMGLCGVAGENSRTFSMLELEHSRSIAPPARPYNQLGSTPSSTKSHLQLQMLPWR